MNLHTFLVTLLPEHCLIAALVLLLGIDIVAKRPRGAAEVTLVLVAAAAVAAAWLHAAGVTGSPFGDQFIVDPTTSLTKAVVLALAVPVVLLANDEFADSRFYTLLVSSLYGVCLVLSSGSFLTLFLGLEIMSLPVYVLVLLAYRRPASAEAALKYLVLSGTATATFLMGASLVYGASGSLSLGAFHTALASNSPLAQAAVVMVVVAFFLKAAIFPFHAWAPDAYEAASVPVTAYMATLIKAAVLLAAVRLFGDEPVRRPLLDLIAVLPLASIVWGNLAAIRQESFRRMIAYSSIAHAGYLFYAFLGEGDTRLQAVAFYLAAYGVMNLLAFAALPPHDDDVQRDRLETMRGLFHRSPYAAIAIGIAMLSLAGIPPFPGFVAKFLVFKNVIAAGHTTYAVLGLVASYLGLYFYLRVVQVMFMSSDAAPAPAQGRAAAPLALAATALCLAASAFLAVLPGWLMARL
jgi:NADH-quinone oxidoreductase subunit N